MEKKRKVVKHNIPYVERRNRLGTLGRVAFKAVEEYLKSDEAREMFGPMEDIILLPWNERYPYEGIKENLVYGIHVGFKDWAFYCSWVKGVDSFYMVSHMEANWDEEQWAYHAERGDGLITDRSDALKG